MMICESSFDLEEFPLSIYYPNYCSIHLSHKKKSCGEMGDVNYSVCETVLYARNSAKVRRRVKLSRGRDRPVIARSSAACLGRERGMLGEDHMMREKFISESCFTEWCFPIIVMPPREIVPWKMTMGGGGGGGGEGGEREIGECIEGICLSVWESKIGNPSSDCYVVCLPNLKDWTLVCRPPPLHTLCPSHALSQDRCTVNKSLPCKTSTTRLEHRHQRFCLYLWKSDEWWKGESRWSRRLRTIDIRVVFWFGVKIKLFGFWIPSLINNLSSGTDKVHV